MQLDLAVIDGFRLVARDVGNMFYNAPGFRGDIRPGYHNHFQDNVLNSKLPTHAIIGDNLVCYCGSVAAQIVFNKIRYSHIVNLQVGEAVVFNQHDTDVIVRQYYNDSDEEMNENLHHEQKETLTHSTDIVAELTSQFATKVSGGNPATFQAEASAQLTAKLGFSMKDSVEVVDDSSQDRKVVIPAHTHTLFSETHSIADISETIALTCMLDADVTVLSDGDFSRSFENIQSLQLYMQGGGGGNNEGIDAYFDSRVYANRVIDVTPLHLTLTDDRISRNNKTSELRRKDENIAA